MEVFLDTNFILTCVRERIDFIEQLKELGFKILVPREVFDELNDLKKNGKVRRDGRALIDLAIEMLDNKDIKRKKLGTGTVDKGLIKKGQEGVFIATLDREIKRNVPNRVVFVSAKKRLEIDRD